ncbi:MAG TPA: ligase-associated DNA damage response DEXH box helicase [Gemmatimonadaceae bacterium]|nr:ligase-associated DNA damage response DEXH box helicase [Gemmatimonadaceae bacterium]
MTAQLRAGQNDMLAPAHEWFASHGWAPFAFQQDVWKAYLAATSGLVHAATGTGKTLAAWWGPLLEYLIENRTSGAAPAVPLRVLWITPLRALASDTAGALQQPVSDIGLPWTIETRTGDTAPSTRSRQSRRLPTALVTTPESLSLLLSRENASSQFTNLRVVVVDEWHELMGTKRGVQTELALAHLRTMCPQLRTWGLSATIGNIEEARRTLIGRQARKSTIVRGVEPKRIIVDSLIPPVIERFPWAGHLGTQMVSQVIQAIEEGNTSIVFTNTRSQTEIWYQAILAHRPEWAGTIALHHGSLDRKTRDWVEDGLREERLRCVVATSSLDLGVDFSPVDRVLQIGSPKGIARITQRAGRSGHRPGASSRITCVPTHTLELLEVAAARDGVEAGSIESRCPVSRPLDVLAQHVVTMAVGDGFIPAELVREVRTTEAYHDLPDDEWEWVLSFVSNGGDALKGYPEYSKVTPDADGRWRVTDRTIARRHRMAIGTIVSDADIVVQYLRGKRLGTVEESFIARLRQGDRFVFAGTPVEFVRVRDMVAWVRRAPDVKSIIPRWMGSRLPLSGELAAALRARLGEAAAGIFRDAEMEALHPILDVQGKWSRIPAADELLIERVHSREGFHLFFFPFEGRLVHEGLAALFAWRISRIKPISFSLSSNDYGFELLSPDEPPLHEALANGLLDASNLLDDIPASLNATEMARRQFREIARVAGLVFPGFPRSGKTARQLQASSGLFFDVFQRYDAGNMLLSQAHREVLERQLERTRLGTTLQRLSSARVIITAPKRTPPLAFPLLVDRNRQRVSSEKLGDRVRRLQRTLERAAGKPVER